MTEPTVDETIKNMRHELHIAMYGDKLDDYEIPWYRLLDIVQKKFQDGSSS